MVTKHGHQDDYCAQHPSMSTRSGHTLPFRCLVSPRQGERYDTRVRALAHSSDRISPSCIDIANGGSQLLHGVQRDHTLGYEWASRLLWYNPILLARTMKTCRSISDTRLAASHVVSFTRSPRDEVRYRDLYPAAQADVGLPVEDCTG